MAKRKQKETTNEPEKPLPAPSKAEQRAIDEARDHVRQRRLRPTIKVDTGKDGRVVNLSAQHNDTAGFGLQLQKAFGTRGTAFLTSNLNTLLSACKLKDGELDATKLNALLAIVDGIEPANEVEAMLAVQMAVSHVLITDLLIRTNRVDQIPQLDCAGNMAAKLLRAFATHAELLHKLKGGGKQTVRVEHVHVHPGAQAIVGNVSPGGRGGEKSEHQPHAPQDHQAGEPRSLTHESGTAMPSLDTRREPLPIASGAR